jgi:uncharacterized protein
MERVLTSRETRSITVAFPPSNALRSLPAGFRRSQVCLSYFMKEVARVLVTDEAKKVIDQLRAKHGPLMFHQSGGCCDGSSPMCYPKDEFIVGRADVWLGQIDGCDFFMAKDQFEFFKHTELTIDVVPGRGASFSLEIPLGVRFITKSRVFELSETENLVATVSGDKM